jgi:D-sedoheptulose 7-phosphate isomerase
MNDIVKIIDDHLDLAVRMKMLADEINSSCELILSALVSGKRILLCGNGGSAADAQHLAAEFTGRFVAERRALPAIALTTDTSALTAIGNDYGFEFVFSRQMEAVASAGDILIAISTSGNSENVMNAVRKGNEIGCVTIGLLGGSGGKLVSMCHSSLVIPSSITARIQEMHILIGHIFCAYIDEHFYGPSL